MHDYSAFALALDLKGFLFLRERHWRRAKPSSAGPLSTVHRRRSADHGSFERRGNRRGEAHKRRYVQCLCEVANEQNTKYGKRIGLRRCVEGLTFSPFLYDIVVTHALEWPTLTTQWFPDKET